VEHCRVVPYIINASFSNVSFDVVIWQCKAAFDVPVALYSDDDFPCIASLPWRVGAEVWEMCWIKPEIMCPADWTGAGGVFFLYWSDKDAQGVVLLLGEEFILWESSDGGAFLDLPIDVLIKDNF